MGNHPHFSFLFPRSPHFYFTKYGEVVNNTSRKWPSHCTPYIVFLLRKIKWQTIFNALAKLYTNGFSPCKHVLVKFVFRNGTNGMLSSRNCYRLWQATTCVTRFFLVNETRKLRWNIAVFFVMKKKWYCMLIKMKVHNEIVEQSIYRSITVETRLMSVGIYSRQNKHTSRGKCKKYKKLQRGRSVRIHLA